MSELIPIEFRDLLLAPAETVVCIGEDTYTKLPPAIEDLDLTDRAVARHTLMAYWHHDGTDEWLKDMELWTRWQLGVNVPVVLQPPGNPLPTP